MNGAEQSKIDKRGSGIQDRRIAWIGIFSLIILVGALLTYKQLFTKSVTSPLNGKLDEVITNSDSDDELKVFYYTVDNSSPQESRYKIFRASPDLNESDINTHSFSIPGTYSLIITDSWKENVVLFASNSEAQSTIYSVDVSSPGSQPQALLTIPFNDGRNKRVTEVRFIDDGTALALVTAEGLDERAENSVLRIFSLRDRLEKENYLLREKSALYAGFSLLGMTTDGRIIYLRETSSDGGYVWSQWHKVNRDTKNAQALEDLPPVAKYEEGPTISVLNPSLTRLVYADFSTMVDPTDLGGEYQEGFDQCLKFNTNLLQKYASLGGIIMMRDLNTGTTHEIFRNLSYQNNYCKNVGSRIVSLKWLDDSRLVFETIDGVYVIDVETRQRRTLLTFEKTASPGQQTRPPILFIQLPYIVFKDRSIIRIDTNKRLEFISPESQKGYFFE